MPYLRRSGGLSAELAKAPVGYQARNAAEMASISRADLAAAVRSAVFDVEAIDVHTHLFPPSHGPLMLWGIDELLTYHYLVSEFFMVAPKAVTPAGFFALPKPRQAELVWEHLFVRRTPVSEACLGVLTTIKRLGRLPDPAPASVADWLPALRAAEAALTPEEAVEQVFKTSKLRYCIMTNIPFEPKEVKYWRPEKNKAARHKYFKSALRVDPLLKGDWPTVAASLEAAGYPASLDGTRAFLVDWIETMNPVYFMASTPHDFEYHPSAPPSAPPSAAPSAAAGEEGGGAAAAAANSITASDLLDKVLMPLAEEYNLPIALKLGAHRCCFPDLAPCGGGDGVIVTDVEPLRLLCLKFPRVKFLATFLSRVNQHQVCILAQKLRNLHIYGCWWYCNNPSIIDEITRMRIELLGTAFTAQHSDSRVLEQLVYKWEHSREAIAEVLTDQYGKLLRTGAWALSAEQVKDDVRRLFGGSYEEFLRDRPVPPVVVAGGAGGGCDAAAAADEEEGGKEEQVSGGGGGAGGASKREAAIRVAYKRAMAAIMPGDDDYVMLKSKQAKKKSKTAQQQHSGDCCPEGVAAASAMAAAAAAAVAAGAGEAKAGSA